VFCALVVADGGVAMCWNVLVDGYVYRALLCRWWCLWWVGEMRISMRIVKVKIEKVKILLYSHKKRKSHETGEEILYPVPTTQHTVDPYM
jgi:hypothetical protein